MRQFSVSSAAESAFLETLDYYTETAGDEIALRFIEAWDAMAILLKEHPLAGSQRFETGLGIQNLRSIPVTNFPYIAFYTVSDDMLRIVGLLHTSQDLPKKLRP
ncbi:MAG: hypothetical protein CFE34_00630 [Rhodobacteraceae bacterium PARR1]|nr:MAG: hypothetical protein CFE34_00630 [Rhodobacteraceae bacterium PARR1]